MVAGANEPGKGTNRVPRVAVEKFGGHHAPAVGECPDQGSSLDSRAARGNNRRVAYHPGFLEAVRKVGTGRVTSRIWAESRRERRGPADGSSIIFEINCRAQHPKFAVTLGRSLFALGLRRSLGPADGGKASP